MGNDMFGRRREIFTIAQEIVRDWGANGVDKIHYAARPYLEAMLTLDRIDGSYGADSARSIVAYFLSNAKTYRGETARRLKAELNAMLKAKAEGSRG